MFVDSSYNDIDVIPDMSVNRFLKTLDLSNNIIEEISGLNRNVYLRVLLYYYMNNPIDSPTSQQPNNEYIQPRWPQSR
jgi:Leucine-rich repeat (LRR) protein